jgi:hypothetical protein
MFYEPSFERERGFLFAVKPRGGEKTKTIAAMIHFKLASQSYCHGNRSSYNRRSALKKGESFSAYLHPRNTCYSCPLKIQILISYSVGYKSSILGRVFLTNWGDFFTICLAILSGPEQTCIYVHTIGITKISMVWFTTHSFNKTQAQVLLCQPVLNPRCQRLRP